MMPAPPRNALARRGAGMVVSGGLLPPWESTPEESARDLLPLSERSPSLLTLLARGFLDAAQLGPVRRTFDRAREVEAARQSGQAIDDQTAFGYVFNPGDTLGMVGYLGPGVLATKPASLLGEAGALEAAKALKQAKGTPPPSYRALEQAAERDALDMSPTARMARAREMGFDTSTPLYHGTSAEFDAFAPGGTYLSKSSRVAADYADTPTGGRVLPVYVRGRQMVLDPRNNRRLQIEQARRDGYTGVEDVRPNHPQTFMFDPRDSRSVNARFDPRDTDSSDLLAAKLGSAGYNPLPVRERRFEQDYPQGARSDGSGRLEETIEGVKLDAPFVAGRRRLGARDEGLGREAVTRIAERVAGSVRPDSLRGNAGLYRRGGSDPGIRYDRSLNPDQATRVIAHEVGHAIDEIAGRIDTSGLSRELSQVYSDLATGQQGRSSHKTGPQHMGYTASESPREMMAEAIRAYMIDPNYLKSVAPQTAARIRALVNEHPVLSRTIQFNARVPIPVGTSREDRR